MIYVDKTFGFVNATKFNFSLEYPDIIDPDTEFAGVLWNFGDGQSSRDLEPFHIYETNGIFDVVATLYVTNKILQTTSKFDEFSLKVKAINYFQKSIYFDNVPAPSYAGHLNTYPYRVVYTSESTEKHSLVVSLKDNISSYCNEKQFSNPQYPQWFVLDSNLNLTNSIQGIQTEIYISPTNSSITDELNGLSVGVSGYADFYVVCDNSNIHESLSTTNFLSLIEVSLIEDKDVKSVNSDISVSFPHIYKWLIPDTLKVKHDFFSRIPYYNLSEILTPISILASYNNPQTRRGDLIDKYYFDHNVFKTPPEISTPEYGQITISIVDAINFEEKLTPTFTYPTKFNSNYSILLPTGEREEFPGVHSNNFYVSNSSTEEFYIKSECSINLPQIEIFNPVENEFYNEPSLIGNFINPTLFLSNPKVGILNKVHISYSEDVLYHNNHPIKVPKLTSAGDEYVNYHLINNIVSLPSPHYSAWVSDRNSGYIYLIDNNGDVLSQINARKFVATTEFVEENVDLLENTLILDSETNLWFYDSGNSYAENLILDSETNLWFFHENTSTLMNFNSAGNCLKLKNLDANFNIIKLEINSEDILWAIVQDKNTFSYSLLKIAKQDLSILQTLETDFNKPYHLFLICKNDTPILCYNTESNTSIIEIWDSNFTSIQKTINVPFIVSDLNLDHLNNLWYISSAGMVVKRNLNTNAFKYKLLESTVTPTNISLNLKNIILDYRSIAFVIDSNHNEIIILQDTESSNTLLQIKDRLIINPSLFNNKYQPDLLSNNLYLESLGGKGDLNGYKWTNKYLYTSDFSNTLSITLSGLSDKVVFLNEKNIAKIRKINESFNFSKKFNQLANLPKLKNSKNLYEYFDICLEYNSFQTYLNTDSYIYEKISNFVINNSDIDTCSYNKLLDYTEMLNYNNLNLPQYSNMPMAIGRLLDICSINIHKLIGQRPAAGLNLKNSLKYGEEYNRGDIYLIEDILEAETSIILRNKYLDRFKLLKTRPLPALKQYTVDFFAKNILNLGSDWYKFYEFYKYIPNTYNPTYKHSIIDWSSDDTNLNISEVNSSKWYNDEGLVESLFSIELYRGLNLLKN